MTPVQARAMARAWERAAPGIIRDQVARDPLDLDAVDALLVQVVGKVIQHDTVAYRLKMAHKAGGEK